MGEQEQRSEAREAIVAQIIAPVVGLALTYWIGTHAASIEIEIRGRLARLRAQLRAAGQGATPGRKVAEWFVRQEAPKVIEAAEQITRHPEGSGD